MTAMHPRKSIPLVIALGLIFALLAAPATAGKRDEYGDTGKWWVEDERFCRQYQSWMEGQAACFQVSLQGDNIGFHDAAGKLVSTGRFK